MSREKLPQPVDQVPTAEAGPDKSDPSRAVAINPTIKTFAGLQVMRLEFELRAERYCGLPNFLGSTFRGALGHALKQIACSLRPYSICDSCQLPGQCEYSYIFETATPQHAWEISKQNDAPRPYILTPPIDGLGTGPRFIKPGQTLSFELTLLGGAVNGLLHVVTAIGEMARRGLGEKQFPFALQSLYAFDAGGKKVSLRYDEQAMQFDLSLAPVYRLSELIERRLDALNLGHRLKLRFHTRARLIKEKELLKEFGFADFSNMLWQRAGNVLAVHGDETEIVDRALFLAVQTYIKDSASAVTTLASALIEQEVRRRSSRQGLMDHNGVIGEVVYEGAPLAKLAPLLVAGELLHVGSGATFGLGKYQIVD